jgi:drug/metabolite transporter (DMT)-like permease
MVALGLALGASIAWGGSDFLAGLAARRLPGLTLPVLSQGAGLLLLLVLLALAGEASPPARAVAVAAGAGLCEMLGFAAFYRSLAIGPMSVVAPVASLAAVVPVAFGVAAGERPAPLVAVGLALAVNRSTSFAVLAAVVVIGRRGLAYAATDLRPAPVIGLLDAGANVLFALALTRGMTSTVGVIGSLYPVTTVALAAIVLRERPRGLQALGVAGVLGGIGLVTAWGA